MVASPLIKAAVLLRRSLVPSECPGQPGTSPLAPPLPAGASSAALHRAEEHQHQQQQQQEVGEDGWRGLEMVGEGWREKVGGRRLKGEGWRRLEKIHRYLLSSSHGPLQQLDSSARAARSGRPWSPSSPEEHRFTPGEPTTALPAPAGGALTFSRKLSTTAHTSWSAWCLSSSAHSGVPPADSAPFRSLSCHSKHSSCFSRWTSCSPGGGPPAGGGGASQLRNHVTRS